MDAGDGRWDGWEVGSGERVERKRALRSQRGSAAAISMRADAHRESAQARQRTAQRLKGSRVIATMRRPRRALARQTEPHSWDEQSKQRKQKERGVARARE